MNVEKVVSNINTIIGMLTVGSMRDPVIKQAHQLAIETGVLINESISEQQTDSNRLTWLLENMGTKGFDDLAGGICSREDIDLAIWQKIAKSGKREVAG